MFEFTLPQTAEDVSESVVVIWYKSEGEAVTVGEVLVEVQTEKATFELEAPVTGVLNKILVGRAEVASVGDALAWIEAEEPEAERETAMRLPQPERQAFIPMSPRLRRLAQQLGVNPAHVVGTEANGRITEDDLRKAAHSMESSSASSAAPEKAQGDAPGASPSASPGEHELTPTRRAIAQRMTQSLQQSAQLTLHSWADVTTLTKERKRMFPEGSWNVWVLRASVLALTRHPELNSSWTDKGIRQYEDVHLGIAVDTEEGLLVPVMRGANKLTLKDMHVAAIRLSEQARVRELAPNELKGSTFTVTNLGNYGIEFFTPILNPPEAGILGVGQVEEFVAVRDGEFQVRYRIPLSLTFDHRVLDGGPAARFLQTVAGLLAQPESLL